jgi:hypothetical protein
MYEHLGAALVRQRGSAVALGNFQKVHVFPQLPVGCFPVII